MRSKLLAIFAAAVLLPTVVHAQAYTYTDLGDLGGGATWVTSINDAGQVTGTSQRGGSLYGFIYDNGTMTALEPLSSAEGINNAGQVVGQDYQDQRRALIYSNGTTTDIGSLHVSGAVAHAINDAGQVVGRSGGHAFLYGNGGMVDLGTLGGNSSDALSINNLGQVVGESLTAGGRQHAFLYSNGSMVDLGTLGGTFSYAASINNTGQIVGFSERADRSIRAFLYQNGEMTDLGTLGYFSAAFGINDLGQIVGYSEVGNCACDRRAFLYSNGKMVNLQNTVSALNSWYDTRAFDINSSGQIVGYGLPYAESPLRAFLLTPTAVPEPASWLMLLGGFGFIGRALRNRRRARAATRFA